MSSQEEKEFIEKAFQKLKERGWFPGQKLEPSAITEQETAAFEQQYQITLPSLYKTFLTSYRLPRNDFNSICSIIERDGDLSPLWLMIDSPRTGILRTAGGLFPKSDSHRRLGSRMGASLH